MGDSFLHNNKAYFADTLLKDTLLNSQGCDSVVNTQLLFLQNSKSQIYKEICLSDTLVFGGKRIATAGLYRDTISNHLGCDSVIELTVKVNYPKQRFDTLYFCNQPQVNYKGKIRTLPALLKDTFLTFEGCDSVVNTALFTDTVKAQFAIDSALKPNIGFINLSLNATNYLWDFGDGATDTSKNPLHTYSDLNMWSSYQPCLIAINAKNCSDTFCENFKFYLFKDVKIVEGFSPNADGVNDTFYIENSKFYPNSELYIMNRYGQIVLHKTQTQNQDLYWDGNYYKPKELLFSAESSEGLYYYFYKYNNANNSVKQGNLYLKR
jgi:gliding motility-associated-like protein